MSNKNNIKVKINIKINNFVLLEPSNISYSLFKLKNRKIWKLQCQHLNFSLFIYSLSSSFLLYKKQILTIYARDAYTLEFLSSKQISISK